MRRLDGTNSAILKAKVALTALGGDQTLAQVAERFDTHPNQANDWKKKLLEKAAAAVDGSADRPAHLRQRLSGESQHRALRRCLQQPASLQGV